MKIFALAMVAAFSLVAIGETHSQTYPTRPVRMLVTFSAGSQADVLARLVGAKLAENSGQQVVVDNRPSAGGIVAGVIVMNATPDGHTLVLHSNAFAVSAALYTKLPYDPLKDFAPVGQVASVPYVLVVAPGLGVKSVSQRADRSGETKGGAVFVRFRRHRQRHSHGRRTVQVHVRD
jgi:tripartite-type tricarboxylate transporter receptor subunit TctC